VTPNLPARRGPDTDSALVGLSGTGTSGRMIYHSGSLQQRLERMGADHLPTKGGARGGRSPSIIVRRRSLRARTRGIGAAPAFTSSRWSGAICVVGPAETNLWPEIARRNALGMLIAAVKRDPSHPHPPSWGARGERGAATQLNGAGQPGVPYPPPW
jgi:hypothetical protein